MILSPNKNFIQVASSAEEKHELIACAWERDWKIDQMIDALHGEGHKISVNLDGFYRGKLCAIICYSYLGVYSMLRFILTPGYTPKIWRLSRDTINQLLEIFSMNTEEIDGKKSLLLQSIFLVKRTSRNYIAVPRNEETEVLLGLLGGDPIKMRSQI